ncbi:hypothetical protein KEM54_001347, partial [Ascosphaera aggregata]
MPDVTSMDLPMQSVSQQQQQQRQDKVTEDLAARIASVRAENPSPPPPSSDQDRTGDGKLLGVRIDVPRRGGSYEKPFYVILRKVNAIGENEVYLTVHRHTVPAFVPLRELEKRYLPLPSALPELENSHNAAVEQEVPLKPSKQPRQDLHSFICMIRNAL